VRSNYQPLQKGKILLGTGEDGKGKFPPVRLTHLAMASCEGGSKQKAVDFQLAVWHDSLK
jgi:hypothetical protein